MSRCFPYPPPGYVRSVVKNEDLVGLIKLQREVEKAKKDRKKEKKRKKEKANSLENGNVEKEKRSQKKRHKDERGKEDEKGKHHQKRKQELVHHVEKSNLTEEHGQPVDSQNSSDSTLTSSKRQKLSPDNMHSPGSIFRIQLPLQRQKDSEVLTSKVQPCPTSGRPYFTCVRDMGETSSRPFVDDEPHPSGVSGSIGREITSRFLNCSSKASQSCYQEANRVSLSNMGTLSVNSKQSDEKAGGVVKLRKSGSRSSSIESRLKDLIGNLTPRALQSDSLELDQNWLFDINKEHKNAVGRCEVNSTVGLLSGKFGLSPCALHLPKVDIYALPYTLPF